jgi:RNA polymerase sigma-54 factor
MKQSLQIKFSQQLTMTPQLQQAIKLLQLPSLELQNEIQQALESNPMLEIEEELEGALVPNAAANKDEPSESSYSESPYDGESAQPQENNAEREGSDSDMESSDLSWDQDHDWESNYVSSGKSSSDSTPDKEIYERQDFSETSLQEHLQWQLNLTHMSDTDRAIANAIIDSITEDGYLVEELQNLQATLNIEYPGIEADEIEAVLHRVQQFDPIGVAARTPAECLKLQLHTYLPDTPGYALAHIIIDHHLELLAARDYPRLKRVTKADSDSLRAAELLIQSLHPKPGALITTSRTEYIVPDVFVTKKNRRWRVELNPELAPKLRINSSYANMIRRADKSDDNNYLKTNLQEARWFLKSLQSRNETILKVARAIVERQRAFFDYGDEAMKPLVLRDIAEELEMHESTISRVTNQKYMHTPRGVFEFKYFFSSHVSTADGGECSATAIRAMIKKMIAAENNQKPLSDSKIAQLLDNQGINVARRTVAKYRESLSIPPSNERKSLC